MSLRKPVRSSQHAPNRSTTAAMNLEPIASVIGAYFFSFRAARVSAARVPSRRSEWARSAVAEPGSVTAASRKRWEVGLL